MTCIIDASRVPLLQAVHFLTWVQQEPQSLVWLAVLHRVAASEHMQHQVGYLPAHCFYIFLQLIISNVTLY